MKEQPYKIAFDFALDNSKIVIPLTATVELHHSDPYYVISDFKSQKQREGTVFPDIKIKRKTGGWVHLEGEKETHLSEAIGKAIDVYEKAVQSRQSKSG